MISLAHQKTFSFSYSEPTFLEGEKKKSLQDGAKMLEESVSTFVSSELVHSNHYLIEHLLDTYYVLYCASFMSCKAN